MFLWCVVMDMALLKDLGLTDSEVKVYLALLELGSTTKGPIVERSGVASSKVYELLEKLAQKGLVSEVIQSGVKHFEAAPPARIMDYVKEKEARLEEQKVALEALLPTLESKRSLVGVGSETQVFKGMNGAKTAFDDILQQLKKGEGYTVLGISDFTPHFERFVVHFHKGRAGRGIRCKILVNEVAGDIGKKLAKTKLTEVRYVRKELFTPVVFILYKDTTLISIGLDEVFVQVRSKNLTKGLEAYANYLWRMGKKD